MTSTKPTMARRWVDEEWMSVRQAALAIPCAPGTVHGLATRGQLEILWVAGRALVSRASVDRLIARRHREKKTPRLHVDAVGATMDADGES